MVPDHTLNYRSIMIRSLQEQGKALLALSDRIDASYEEAVELMLACKGRVIISGMGKSGIIGKKIAATLASTGTHSFFMHPGEAFHGDLGMVRSDQEADLIVLLSYSGETEEVLKLIPSLKSFGNKIIAITGGLESTLAKHADIVLDGCVAQEVCPLNLAPTTSTTVALAIGDALAIALIKARNFQPQDFARFHPGGSLGRRLLTRVSDVMNKNNLPLVNTDTAISDAVLVMTETRTGTAIVLNRDKSLAGVVTDGDLRRYLTTSDSLKGVCAKDIMTPNPLCISQDMKLSEAEAKMRSAHVKCLIAVDVDQQVTGLLDWAD
ncbi:MAG: KpsF/GutQ family sugar-phosphate isomerase [Endozoicomonas sp. (ex Botrylloides leachii)]|nr:KpsF/GutQ family sugar-phosphate isomerase [Endozoicomonas sp. (ex Botrylloides leachii)]